MVFFDVLLPVVLVAGCGLLVGRLIDRDPEILAKLAFYVLTPALLFYAIYSRPVSGAALGTVFLFVFVFHGLLFIGGYLGSRVLGLERETRTAATLTLSLSNTGNYGLPVLLFAFKEAGFALGILYILAHMAFQITFGAGIASWRKGMSVWRLPLNLLKIPWLYAFGLALLLKTTGVTLPEAISRPIELLYQAAIPTMLLLLGIELSRVKLRGVIGEAIPLTLVKLIVPPLLAWGLTAALGLHGLLRSVLIVEASTPAAVNSLILSLQYNRRPDLVSPVVFLTTVGNLATMGIVLSLLT
jgi:malate permease and related proteins